MVNYIGIYLEVFDLDNISTHNVITKCKLGLMMYTKHYNTDQDLRAYL